MALSQKEEKYDSPLIQHHSLDTLDTTSAFASIDQEMKDLHKRYNEAPSSALNDALSISQSKDEAAPLTMKSSGPAAKLSFS